jgi:hypothetical protein
MTYIKDHDEDYEGDNVFILIVVLLIIVSILYLANY